MNRLPFFHITNIYRVPAGLQDITVKRKDKVLTILKLTSCDRQVNKIRPDSDNVIMKKIRCNRECWDRLLLRGQSAQPLFKW